MNLADLLPREHILVPVEAATVRDAVRALVRRLGDAGHISAPETLERILAEEQLRDVVAIGDHVALPHFRTDAVQQLVAGLAIASDPLDAADAGLDSRPRVVVLIMAPPQATAPYLKTVSAVMRWLRKEGVIQHLLQASSPDDVRDIPELTATRIQPRLTARDLMSHRVFSVGPDTTLREVVDILIRRRIRAIPVVGDKNEVLGMISDGDVMRALMPQVPRAVDEQEDAEPTAARDLRVRDIMSRTVLCVPEDMSLQELASTLINKNLYQLPVVSEGTLTGIVSRSDIIRKLFGR